MNELIRWDYNKSVQKMCPLVVKLKTLTSEMLEELYQAREALSNPRARTDLVCVPNGTQTWSRYLKDIGLARTTAHRWLGLYDPVEKKKIEPPPKEPIKTEKPIINDEEYERRKEAELTEEEPTRPLDEIFEDVQKVIVRQDNEEVFREFDLGALIDELRRRIVSISDPSRRHHAINQIIKAMREQAIECDRLSVSR